MRVAAGGSAFAIRQGGFALVSRSNIARRDFLKAAAATVAAPTIVPGTSLGAGGLLAPSSRINLALIGNGLVANRHLGAMLGRGDVQIRAVCDVKQPNRADFKRRVEQRYANARGQSDYKGCEAYNEFERVLERDDIDAVIVAVPDHWHAIIATRAIEAGKDVYCEKPLTLTVREAEHLADAARRYGTIFQTGSQQRSNGAFRQAATIVRNGWIGQIKQVHVHLGEFPPDHALPAQSAPESIDYDRWLGPAPWQPYHETRVKGDYGGGWRIFRDYSGRKNTDWGAHHFDIIQWALGMDGSGPVRIIPPGHDGYEYQTHVYESGAEVQRRSPEQGMIGFHGTEGTVWVARGGFIKTDPPSLARKSTKPGDEQLYVSNNHHDNWLEGIRTRQETIAPAWVGASSATVCHLCNIGQWLDRPFDWDPEHRRVKGDAHAARWLDRPDRAPWQL
jgi:predicted dehydrogenase